MTLESENVGLPGKGVKVVNLVVLVLIWVHQIDDIISWEIKSGKKKEIALFGTAEKQ